MAVDRDLVFISYSPEQPVWRDKLQPFLNPWVLEGFLQVWADTYIEVGGAWRREISTAVARTRVGVLLVDQGYLASSFIIQEELPALLDASDRGLAELVYVPVGATTLSPPLREARILDFLWRDDPTPLDPLDGPGCDQALAQLGFVILEAAGVGTETSDVEPRETVEKLPAAPLEHRTSGEIGTPHDVPAQRPHFIPRPELLKGVRAALTSDTARVGLCGPGGVGKSVLAIALASDPDVLRAFPGGVFWLTVGRDPNLLDLQRVLATALGGRVPIITNLVEGRRLLRERWGERVGLLVLDDLWASDHAEHLDVLGSKSRMLITTRHTAVTNALLAHQVSVARLGEADALGLLAAWADVDRDALPSVAAEVAAECGYVPLELTVAGALVKDRGSWDDVLSNVRARKAAYLTHPSGDAFAFIRLSTESLAPADRERYYDLATFRWDDDVPEDVVCFLWGRAGLDHAQSRQLLKQLASKGLLYLERSNGKTLVTFHELQRDFLSVAADDIRQRANQLIDATPIGGYIAFTGVRSG